MPLDSNHTRAISSPYSTDLLHLHVMLAQVPRSPDLAIFVSTARWHNSYIYPLHMYTSLVINHWHNNMHHRVMVHDHLVCVYVCMCVRACMHACRHVYTCVCMCICVCELEKDLEKRIKKVTCPPSAYRESTPISNEAYHSLPSEHWGQWHKIYQRRR